MFLATGTTDKPQILRLRLGGTFTFPVWVDIDTGQSVVEKLITGTWNSDGKLIRSEVISGKGDPTRIEPPITPDSLSGSAGDILIITLEGIGGGGSNTGSLSWLEVQ